MPPTTSTALAIVRPPKKKGKRTRLPTANQMRKLSREASEEAREAARESRPSERYPDAVLAMARAAILKFTPTLIGAAACRRRCATVTIDLSEFEVNREIRPLELELVKNAVMTLLSEEDDFTVREKIDLRLKKLEISW